MSLAIDGFVTFLAGCIEYKFQILLLHYPDVLERAAKTHGADEAVMWCDYPASQIPSRKVVRFLHIKSPLQGLSL